MYNTRMLNSTKELCLNLAAVKFCHLSILLFSKSYIHCTTSGPSWGPSVEGGIANASEVAPRKSSEEDSRATGSLFPNIPRSWVQ